jgi:hypothetical protein
VNLHILIGWQTHRWVRVSHDLGENDLVRRGRFRKPERIAYETFIPPAISGLYLEFIVCAM